MSKQYTFPDELKSEVDDLRKALNKRASTYENYENEPKFNNLDKTLKEARECTDELEQTLREQKVTIHRLTVRLTVKLTVMNTLAAKVVPKRSRKTNKRYSNFHKDTHVVEPNDSQKVPLLFTSREGKLYHWARCMLRCFIHSKKFSSTELAIMFNCSLNQVYLCSDFVPVNVLEKSPKDTAITLSPFQEEMNKFFDKVMGSTASTTKTLVKLERRMRARLQRILLENLQEMQGRVLQWEDEATEREVLQCVMETQMQNAKHPHRFLKKLGVPKGYECGFVCDECGVDVPLDTSSKFYHCSCGMDLCLTCHELYVAKCTCANCGKILPNRIALVKHIAAQSCVKRPRMEELDNTDEVAAPKPKSPAENRSKKKRTKANPSPTVAASLAPASAAVTTAPFTEAAEHTPPAFHQQQVSSEPWGAFDRMISKRKTKESPQLPTPAEERQLLQGEWIRFFQHFPPSGDVPTALTYHIQPGRTGAIFNEHGVTIHSAVVSPFERRCYVVESIDMEGEDTVFLLSLEAAKVQFSYEVDLVQQAAYHHSKMLKLRRAPGTMAICQAPTTAVRCFGDPVVFARWALADTTQNIALFSLSNGYMQAFVNDSYEIRWMENEERKFCVRSNGRCELIDEATCAVMPYIDALLDQNFVNDEDTDARLL